MVQVIDRPASFLESILGSANQGLQGITQGFGALQGARRGAQERESLAGQYGEQFRNIRDPRLQQLMLQGAIEKENQAAKLAGEYKADEESYSKIKNAFGEKFADVWRASPTGARTALTHAALEARARGIDLDQILGGISREPFGMSDEFDQQEVISRQPSEGRIRFPKINLDIAEKTPKEISAYKETLRKENSPLYRENANKERALKDTSSHLKILEKLNDSIPEGTSRLLIDKEGNIRPTALRFKAVPPSVEQFAKTVNDFLTSAKDIFGSRVTNYDIAQFKARLPTLLNSKEGRSLITRQMQIFNELERNYRSALKDIYNHYGLGGITEEQAERLADQIVAEKEEMLRQELVDFSGNDEDIQQERPSLEEIFG